MPYSSKREARGFSFIEVLVAVVTLIVLAALALPSYGVLNQRLFNATALSDVLNAGKALEGLTGDAAISITVTGPQLIPGVSGPVVSDGTTLFLMRSPGGETYVRGSHPKGTATYYFVNGSVYAEGASLD